MLWVAPWAPADAPRTGVITGTVTDSDGAPLAGAAVQLRCGRGELGATSGQDGRFRFGDVIPGLCAVGATMPGFQPVAGEIIVSAGDRRDVDLVLSPAVADEIVVTAEPPLVNPYDVSGGGTLGRLELERVVGSSQAGFASWIAQLPGALDGHLSQRGAGSLPTIEGVEWSRQMYFVDGVDVSFPRTGGSNALGVPTGAVQEMKVATTGADAEFSRTVGSYVSVITRSGTNELHGRLSYLPSNASWVGQQERFEVERDDELHHNWEVSLGGPFIRDRLWFYGHFREAHWPSTTVLADGESVITTAYDEQVSIVKLDWSPSAGHTLTASFMDTPNGWQYHPYTAADPQVIDQVDGGGDVTSLRWSSMLRDRLLVEGHLATTDMDQRTSPYVEPVIDPSCAHDQPCGNAWAYFSLDDILIHNGGVGFEGHGETAYPRDQGNLSLNLFAGRHDLKLGVDVQRTSFEMAGVAVPNCIGYGYNPQAPGGFALPVGCAFYPTREEWQGRYGPVEVTQDNTALYLRDRFDAGRWSFNLGVRLDDQRHANDVGEAVLDSTDLAPRLAASYDVRGDGTLLVTASAGRYIAHMAQGWSTNFTDEPAGRIHYDVYYWDPATWSGYDLFGFRIAGTETPEPVDPAYKDEFTVGTDWQFHPDWAFRARAVYWERRNFPDILDQVDAGAELVREVANTPGAAAERRAVNLSVHRRYADSWSLLAAYTWSRTEGNCPWDEFGGCEGELGKLSYFTSPDGVPWSRVNRWGPLPEDREHNLKVSGSYRLELGRGHSLDLSGYVYYQSGQPWQRTEIVLEPLFQRDVVVFTEPRGARRNPDQHQLNLSVGWSFPVSGRLTGQLLFDVINATDEHGLIGTIGRDADPDGEPYPTSINYQLPRWYRFMATLRF